MVNATIPEEAIKKLVPVVNAISEDVIFGDGDWETALYFRNMLDKKPMRSILAEIAVEVRKTEPKWTRINHLLDDLHEDGLDVSSVSSLAMLQCDAADMLLIPRVDPKRLKDYLKMVVSKGYDESETTSVFRSLNKLMRAYMEGKEKTVLEEEPFRLDYLQRRMMNWAKKTCGAPVPTPLSLRGKRKRPEVRQQIKGLRRARQRLENQGGEDPLEAARKLAKTAGKGRGEALYDKKKSAKSLEFSDSEEDVDEPDEELEEEPDDELDEPVELSEVPNRFKSARKRKRSPQKPRSPASGKKHKWTRAQRNALKAAVEDYGEGSWAEIRDSENYRQFWKGRVNVGVGLKDLWRTMKLKGEV